MQQQIIEYITTGRVVLAPGITVGPYATATGWRGFAVITKSSVHIFGTPEAAATQFLSMWPPDVAEQVLRELAEELAGAA